MVVAGAAKINKDNYAFIYYIDEWSCSVRWMFYLKPINGGVKQIAFDPNNRNLIFGVGTSFDEGSGVWAPHVFFIDNTYPLLTNTVQQWALTGTSPTPLQILSMNIMDTVGKMEFTMNDRVMYFYAMDNSPRSWTLANNDVTNILANYDSSYSASRGTYILAYESDASSQASAK